MARSILKSLYYKNKILTVLTDDLKQFTSVKIVNKEMDKFFSVFLNHESILVISVITYTDDESEDYTNICLKASIEGFEVCTTVSLKYHTNFICAFKDSIVFKELIRILHKHRSNLRK